MSQLYVNIFFNSKICSLHRIMFSNTMDWVTNFHNQILMYLRSQKQLTSVCNITRKINQQLFQVLSCKLVILSLINNHKLTIIINNQVNPVLGKPSQQNSFYNTYVQLQAIVLLGWSIKFWKQIQFLKVRTTETNFDSQCLKQKKSCDHYSTLAHF